VPWLEQQIKVPKWAIALGVIELLGGLAGAGYSVAMADKVLAEFPGHPTTAMMRWGMVATMVFVYGLAALAGGLLLAGRRAGWTLSRAVQIMQLVQFKCLGVQYLFVLGLAVIVSITGQGILEFHWQLNGEWWLAFGLDASDFQIGFNGAAAIWLALLLDSPVALPRMGAHAQQAG
jgi:hypothetical protein